MATITVHNIDTYDEYVYVDLAPGMAVRNAFAQYQKKDFNTFDYDAKYPVSMVTTRPSGNKTVYTLGQFSAVA
jgi:hypothetical protein